MKNSILLCFFAFAAPTVGAGQTLDASFKAAIEAVEKRDHETLEQILDENPDVLTFEATTDCPLLCEFTQLIRPPREDELIPKIDATAIQIILDRGAPIDHPIDIINRILPSTNDFRGDTSEYPINSGECTKNRGIMFPLVNRLIASGARTDLRQQTTSEVTFSTGFYYFYQLCLRPFVCGAEYETASTAVIGQLVSKISDDEQKLTRNLISEGALDAWCAAPILNIER